LLKLLNTEGKFVRNESGEYVFISAPQATYRIAAESSGFRGRALCTLSKATRDEVVSGFYVAVALRAVGRYALRPNLFSAALML